jgi:hypothetical protein
LGPLESYLKNEAAACKITLYSMAHLVGFAWSKVASVGFGVSGLESAGVDPSATDCLIVSSPFLITAKL